MQFVCLFVCLLIDDILYGILYRHWIRRAVMSIIYAVVCGTAVGSPFPGALTLRLGRLGVGLTARFRLVPGLGMRGAVPPLPASSWRVV
jgi:hypothetical protein